MEKLDFKKTLKGLYAPSPKDFVEVDVPDMQFLMIDGEGDPNVAKEYADGIDWLYSVSYGLKFLSKKTLERDYTVPPLEALWWADDMRDFANGNRDAWKWRQMIMVPDFITRSMFADIRASTIKKLGEPPPSLRLERFTEGRSVQILHIGSYSDEAPTIRRLHQEYLPLHGLVEDGWHHEIYLSDPRRVEPAKLRTIIRQPVRKR